MHRDLAKLFTFNLNLSDNNILKVKQGAKEQHKLGFMRALLHLEVPPQNAQSYAYLTLNMRPCRQQRQPGEQPTGAHLPTQQHRWRYQEAHLVLYLTGLAVRRQCGPQQPQQQPHVGLPYTQAVLRWLQAGPGCPRCPQGPSHTLRQHAGCNSYSIHLPALWSWRLTWWQCWTAWCKAPGGLREHTATARAAGLLWPVLTTTWLSFGALPQ